MADIVNIDRKVDAFFETDFEQTGGNPVARLRAAVSEAFARFHAAEVIRREALPPRFRAKYAPQRKPVPVTPIKGQLVFEAIKGAILHPIDDRYDLPTTPARVAAIASIYHMIEYGADVSGDLVPEVTEFVTREIDVRHQVAANVSPFLVALLENRTGRKLTDVQACDAADYVQAIIELSYQPKAIAFFGGSEVA